jgi:predicted phage terminase large subunit-like protein
MLSFSRGAGNAISPSLHGPLCQYLMTTPYRENLYLLARGHLKTTIITVARTILRILRNPQSRTLIVSNKADNANAMLSDIKVGLSNPDLVAAFPHILYVDPERQARKWTENVIMVQRKRHTREGTVEAIGATGEITSRHYEHIVYDDLVGKENSQTREELQKSIEFIRLTEPLLDPGGTKEFLGTTWHYADAYAHLLEQQRHHGRVLGTYIVPCWQDAVEGQPGAEFADGFGWKRPTFPERFTIARLVPGKESLMGIRAKMGSAWFASQYLLDPVSADTAFFARDRVQIKRRSEMPAYDSMWVAMTVDPAISTKAWADYSAIAAIGFDRDGAMQILDLRRGLWPPSELVARIYDVYDGLRAKGANVIAVGFEAIGFAKVFRRLFEQEGETRGYLPVVSLERDTKITKNVRIRALQPLWEAGEITIASECEALEAFLDEAERFRTDKENTHDDLLDAVVDSLQLRARPGGVEPPVSIYDDPEVLERAAFERELLARRPHLDHSSVRAAWSHEQRKRQFSQEQELAGSGAMSEWSG